MKASTESLVVVIWALLEHMTAAQIENAADELAKLPVVDMPGIGDLLRVMREEAASR